MSKKRANGEGSIRKRKDGRWEGRYTAGYDKDGKVITKNVLGKTQAEVKEKLKTAIEESQKLDPTRTGQYTVQTWVTLWYEVFIKPQIRPNIMFRSGMMIPEWASSGAAVSKFSLTAIKRILRMRKYCSM